MPEWRSIADICLGLAETAKRRRHLLLAHLLTVAAAEAQSKRATADGLQSVNVDLKEVLVGAWDWEMGTDLVFADHKVASYFGLDPEEAYRGAPVAYWIDAIHPEDRAKTYEAIRRAIETREIVTCEYRVMTTHGLRWVFARGRCICDADNVPIRFPGALIDITDEKTSS